MASQPGTFNVQEFADLGTPLVGGRLYTYAFGTTTQKTAYTDAAGTIPHTYTSDGAGGLYIALNSRGELPAPLYLASGSYDLALKRSDASSVWTRRAEGSTSTSDAFATSLAASTGSALVGGAFQVVNTIAALRALLKTSNSTKAFVTGYYASGDGGGGAYYYDSTDTTTADNGGSVIVASDGGRWKLASTSYLSVKQFGAKGDGVTDDRVAIQAAITATPYNGTLYVPATNLTFYSVSKASGNYCLLVTKALNLIGDGLYSAINPDTSATALVDTISITLAAGFAAYGMTFDGFTLGNPNNGARHGRHGIFIDTQVATVNLQKPVFRRLSIQQGDGTNPNAIYHLNNGTNNVNGGMYGAEIVDCPHLAGGIKLDSSGDSNIIHRNIITGNGVGVYATLVSGASLLTIQDNNITTDGGAIRVDAGPRTKIVHNNMEQQVATTGQVVMVYLSGLSGTMTMCEVHSNHIGAFTGSNMTACVQIGANVQGTLIADNTMLNSNVGATVVIINAGISTRIGFNQYGTNITAPVTDTGTGTMGVAKTLTLQNSWVTQTGFAAPTFEMDLFGSVTMRGEIANGTTTTTTVLAALPAAYWPLVTQDFPATSASGGVYGTGVFNINATNGNITIIAGSNGQFGLAATWRAAGASALSSDV